MSKHVRRCTLFFLSLIAFAAPAIAQVETTAWDGSRFRFDVPGMVSSSDVVLQRPNRKPTEAMPLGNGRLGAAVWAADGMTVQLNRADTLPHRLSPGQVVLPTLQAITSATDFHGELRLYDGELVESGGGMRATVAVDALHDALIIDVRGADPNREQTAMLRLWQSRHPRAEIAGQQAWLQETWKDEGEPGASGRPFGSLAGISAKGRSVRIEKTDDRTLTLHVTPTTSGQVTYIITAPEFHGGGNAQTALAAASRNLVPGAQSAWWHAFWRRAALIRVHSADGAGDYMENLRNLYLFVAAAEGKSDPPGSQAGIADLISSAGDVHRWDPAAFWHWNLRMQVAANLDAGLPELNLPYFRLYEGNLAAMRAWTRERMHQRPGVCVPETMRFNGNGIEYEVDVHTGAVTTGMNCDGTSAPYYNARTISTGAEVSFWAWRQYLATRDSAFLRRMYPLMRAAAQFLLTYEADAPDGLRHTSPSNAHETQWDVQDPITDLAARKTLYPILIEAATRLGTDEALVQSLRVALTRIPAFPLSVEGQQTPVNTLGAHTMLAESWNQAAARHNVENLGLEPVWPYGLIGLQSDPQTLALARRTYAARPFPFNQDWSYDPLQAAHLGLAEEVAHALRKLTETYQAFPNGMANWGGDSGEFYIEQSGVVAATLAEALVQEEKDGTLRIAPAIPKAWQVAGQVAVRQGTRVDVELHDGEIQSVVVEAGPSVRQIQLHNPWPGRSVEVRSASGRVTRFVGDLLRIHMSPGLNARLTPVDQPAHPFAVITGDAAGRPRRLGPASIGLASQ